MWYGDKASEYTPKWKFYEEMNDPKDMAAQVIARYLPFGYRDVGNDPHPYGYQDITGFMALYFSYTQFQQGVVVES